jgi:hypothetical protein
MELGLMALGYGSDAINGQLVGMRTMDGYKPMTYGPVVNVGTASVSAVPPSLGAGGGTINGSYTNDGNIINNSGATNTANAAYAAQHPWDFANSPVPMALIMLFAGLLGLRLIHWR